MFSFFKKKNQPVDPTPEDVPAPEVAPAPAEVEKRSWLDRIRGVPATPEPAASDEPETAWRPAEPVAAPPPAVPPVSVPTPPPVAPTVAWSPPPQRPATPVPVPIPSPVPAPPPLAPVAVVEPAPEPEPERRSWMDKLRGGLRKTGSTIAQVFTGTQIDEALFEELESALLMADAGVKATQYLLDDLRWRVKEERAADPKAVKALLANAITDLLRPLERGLTVGEHVPTVIMVVGVNGAGKTTSIGKLTRHLADADQKVLLAAADTFRAAAREQLAVWAGRNRVEIVGQDGGDPAAVTFDAVVAGKARGCDVVIADTAGRLTTQVHLMDELKKIRRVIGKAQEGAPHEVLLVVDGNTGQNALTQVQAFDAALGLTGLVITKLDGTAKGGVLAAIALWSRERSRAAGGALPVYFIGVGEKLEDLQTFDAREFAQALLN